MARIMHISPISYHRCFSDLIEEQKKAHDVFFCRLRIRHIVSKCEIFYENNQYKINTKYCIDNEFDKELSLVLLKLFKKIKPDIIHVQLFAGMSLHSILSAASNLGIRKIVTLHDHVLLCPKGICYNNSRCLMDKDCDCEYIKSLSKDKNYLTRRMKRIQNIINQCDNIICPSNDQKDKLDKLYITNNKTIALHYGLSIKNNCIEKTNEFDFGYLGNLSETKGIDSILYLAKNSDAKILMAISYDEDNQSELYQIQKIEKYDNITILLNIGLKEIPIFFSKIKCLLIPSRWDETGPMTIFESFHFKTPVIIRNIPSMVEKVNKLNSIVFNQDKDLITIYDKIKKENINLLKFKFNYKEISQYATEIESVYYSKIYNRNLFLKLGFLCNNNCIFCVTSDNTYRQFVSLNNLKFTLENNRNKYSGIVLTGGEPTIRKDFFIILDIIYYYGYKINLQTNGRLLSVRKYIDVIEKYNIKIDTFLNSFNENIHDFTTRSQGSFKETVQAINNLDKSRVTLKIMITKANKDGLLKTLEFVSQLGVKKIMLVFLTPYGTAGRNFFNVIPKYSEIDINGLLNYAVKKFNVKLEGFPYCQVDEKYRGLISEEKFTYESLDGLAPGQPIYNCKYERVNNQKSKNFDCKNCRYNNKCEGIYNTYLDNYGGGEFLSQ